MINKLSRVNNSRNMNKFLEDYIRWRVRVHSFEINNTSYNTTTYNNLIFSRLCASCNDPENDNENITDELLSFHLGYFVLAMLALGLVCLLGNGITAIHGIKTFMTQKSTEPKERKVFNLLVLNLCISDSMMGFYLTVGPIILIINDQENIPTSLCNTLGIINVLSMQASASIITIISAYRLFSVLLPFKNIHIKATASLLVLVWLSWLFILTLPLFNETHFAHEFTREILVNSKDGNRTLIKLPRFIQNLQSLAQSINGTNDIFTEVLGAATKYQSNEVAVQLLKSFSLIDFEHDKTEFVNYYYLGSACTVTMFVEAKNPTTNSYFSLFLLVFNLMEYVFILIAYSIMFKNISKTRFRNLLQCTSQKCCLKVQGQQTAQRRNENKQVYGRIFAVVITDLICGIPISLLSLAYYFEDLFVSDCVRSDSFVNVATLIALTLFPLNSIINPYIYSFDLWKSFFKRCKKRLLDCKSSTIIIESSCENNIAVRR